jgi:hypothetical protein
VRGETEGARERVSQRGRERRASVRPYLLARPSGGVHHGGRSGDGRSSTEQLVDQRSLGWASVGLRLGRERERVGLETTQAVERKRKNLFFL